MDNMEFNNIDENRSDENIIDQANLNDNAQEAADDLNPGSETPYNNENQRSGYINIQSVPVKKSRFKKIAPVVAMVLVSAMVGGIAGGAFVNYALSERYTYTSPITSSISQAQIKATDYTPPNSLIGKIAESVGPAVVGITTTRVVSEGIFGLKQEGTGTGSGVIFDSKGLIVTNQHVIDGGKEIYVKLPGGKELKARVLGADSMSDLAVLQINADNLPAISFGDSSSIRVGDLAVAIGNPMGEEYAGTVTSGIISAVNRKMYVSDGSYSRRYNLIQTDAAINPGNSGGALLNEKGQLIGINTIKYIGEDVEGMGFAIPVNEVKNVIDQLMENGYVSRPMLNVSAGTVTEEMAREYNQPVGASVEIVQQGGAAEAAGIKAKDIITEIDGAAIKSSDELIAELEKHKVGDSVTLEVWREGQTLTIKVTLGDSRDFTN